MELRIRDDRPVLVGHDGAAVREVDPDSLPLGHDLTGALREWARVATAVDRGEADSAAPMVSRRGAQLAGRIAAVMGVPVTYVDPVSGEVTHLVPDPPRPAPPPPAEPAPWSTGSTVAVFAMVISGVAVIGLAATLRETNALLALVSNVVITAGLAPSVWLARRVVVWRWVAAGVAAGLAVSWLALPFIILT
ncbi:DUF2537 domain-containing protein [Actinokineospora pegani]|uniref:DUF2537 domain-containing protein n=1 Tax=Actinokineospora pegani TaxID=2654637 RepID=UPI0012E9CD26|nr:DUF2537 domain-containing protein [Actinokineospora pegani]